MVDEKIQCSEIPWKDRRNTFNSKMDLMLLGWYASHTVLHWLRPSMDPACSRLLWDGTTIMDTSYTLKKQTRGEKRIDKFSSFFNAANSIDSCVKWYTHSYAFQDVFGPIVHSTCLSAQLFQGLYSRWKEALKSLVWCGFPKSSSQRH